MGCIRRNLCHSEECPGGCVALLVDHRRSRTLTLLVVLAARIVSNFKQVELTQAQYDAISAIGKDNHIRFNVPFAYCTEADPKWDVNIFSEGAEKDAAHQVKIF